MQYNISVRCRGHYTVVKYMVWCLKTRDFTLRSESTVILEILHLPQTIREVFDAKCGAKLDSISTHAEDLRFQAKGRSELAEALYKEQLGLREAYDALPSKTSV